MVTGWRRAGGGQQKNTHVLGTTALPSPLLSSQLQMGHSERHSHTARPAAVTHGIFMLSPAARRLMPTTRHFVTLAVEQHAQRRLACICPPPLCYLRRSQRNMSSASTATSSAPAAASATSTPANPVTFIPRHHSLPDIQPQHRVLFVGDVHGCFDELLALLDKAAVTPGSDYILLAGDLINKGPKPLELLEWLRTTPRAYSVLGNHDHHVIRAMQRQADDGGRPPSDCTYTTHPHDYVAAHLTPQQRDWYLSLPLTIRLPALQPPHLLVHAGLVPGVALDAQLPFDLLNIRNVLSDGSGSKKKSEGVNWVERYGGEEGTVVFGHCAARGVQLVKDESGGMRCIGLDSGCCYGNKLSGWLLPEQRLVQVDAFRMYSKPDE